MTIAIALMTQDLTRRRILRIVKPTFSSNYATGGQVIDLTALTNGNNIPRAAFGKNPDIFAVLNMPPGYLAVLVPGTNLTNWKVKLYQQKDPANAGGADIAFTELAAAAYPAAITGATDIRFLFESVKSDGSNSY